MEPTHIQLNDEQNALDYLERSVQFLGEVEVDPLAWKWVVIALHGALYGFAIAAAKGTNPDNVKRTTRTGKKILFTLDEVLELCQDPRHMKMLSFSNHLVLSEQQKASIHLLNQELRNVFEHFSPMGWLLYVDGMPNLTEDVLDVVLFLALETGTYVHLSETEQERVKDAVGGGKEIVRAHPDHDRAPS